MQQELTDVVLDIRGNRDLLTADEASIKAGVVLRLLRVLGWDPFNIREITPEYAIGGRRVDFALRALGANKVFVEVKRPREDLELHQEQLLSYSFTEGVKLAVLTNGMTWWLYLPLSEGSWEQRRFYNVDLLEQEPTDVAKRLIEFLSKNHVVSGEAVQTAEHVYRSRQKTAIVRDSIPKAWNKILTDPDDLFVDLLIETTEKLCGFRPELAEIEEFLKVLSARQSATPFQPPSMAPVFRRPQVANPGDLVSRFRPSGEIDFMGKKIENFTLFGKTYYPKTWQDLLLTVTTEVYRRHPHDFEKCLTLRGSKVRYFSKIPNELSSPKRVADSNYYCEAKLNANSIVRRSRDLLTLFGYNEKDLEVKAK
jgi:hypothetical protein